MRRKRRPGENLAWRRPAAGEGAGWHRSLAAAAPAILLSMKSQLAAGENRQLYSRRGVIHAAGGALVAKMTKAKLASHLQKKEGWLLMHRWRSLIFQKKKATGRLLAAMTVAMQYHVFCAAERRRRGGRSWQLQ